MSLINIPSINGPMALIDPSTKITSKDNLFLISTNNILCESGKPNQDSTNGATSNE